MSSPSSTNCDLQRSPQRTEHYIQGSRRSPPSPNPSTGEIEPKYLDIWDEDTDRFSNFQAESFSVFCILFFFPSFVWAFNELKLAIYQSKERLRSYQRDVVQMENNRAKHDAVSPRQTKVMDPPTVDFTVGTAFQLRKEYHWTSILANNATLNTAPFHVVPAFNPRKRTSSATFSDAEYIRLSRRRGWPTVSYYNITVHSLTFPQQSITELRSPSESTIDLNYNNEDHVEQATPQHHVSRPAAVNSVYRDGQRTGAS